MPTVIIPPEPGPSKIGDPENFTRVCRGYAEHTVQAFVKVDRWVVPPDGAWFVNGLWNPPGTERSLRPGDKVTYHATGRNPLDDRPAPTAAPALRFAGGAARVDRFTSRRLRYVNAPRRG